LDASELARLLVTRAMRVRRLPKAPRDIVKSVNKRIGHRSLTAHFHEAEVVANFDRYAGDRGVSRAAAFKNIVERELRERWLAKAFNWTPKGPGYRRRPSEAA
jgi:hypothetical protein